MAGEQPPEWLWDRIEYRPLDNIKEEKVSQIKAASMAMINTAWGQDRTEFMKMGDQNTPSYSEKILLLIQHKMLPHLRTHPVDGICIKSSFISELKNRHGISRISMKQLADICGWEYKSVRLCDVGNDAKWVVCTPLEQYSAFITDGSEQTTISDWKKGLE